MMTLSPIKQFNYYKESEHNDYYFDGDNIGEWFGALTSELCLPNNVSEADMDKVFSGVHPKTLERLNNRSTRFGFDLTFSAPKSVSVVYAQSSKSERNRISNAHLEAVKDALGYLEQQLVRFRVDDQLSQNGLGILAALQTHYTSRELDPQLHTHALLANMTLTDNGTLRCMDTRVLYHWQKVIGAFYRVCLSTRISALGYETESDNDAFRIKSVDRDLEHHFSTRTQQIKDVLDQFGINSSASAAGDIAKMATRKQKAHITGKALEDFWADKLKSFTPKCLQADVNVKTKISIEKKHPLIRLTEQKSTFKKQDLYYQTLLDLQTSEVSIDQIYDGFAKAKLDPELQALIPDQIYTTRQVLRLESEMLAYADELSASKFDVVSAESLASHIKKFEAQSSFKLDSEQVHALEHACFSESSFVIVQGSAGAGKTTVMAIVKAVYESDGYGVIGASFTKKAADNLADESGIKSFTIDKLLSDYDRSKNHFKKNKVLVIDEAGLIGTRKLHRIFEIAKQENLKVVLTGEDKQLDAIEHGGALRYLTNKFGAKRIEKIFRQTKQTQREIVPLLRDGNTKEALERMFKHKMLNFCKDHDGTIDRLIADWSKYQKVNPTKSFLISAAKWREVDVLSARVRQILLEQKVVNKDGVYLDCIVGLDGYRGRYQMAVGDKIRFTKNDYFMGVANGNTGKITQIDVTESVKISVRLTDGRLIKIDTSKYCDEDKRVYLVHAYATTIFSSQGLTVDGDTFILYDTSLDRDDTYVAGSRHRDKSNWYINVDQLVASRDLKLSEHYSDSDCLELLAACFGVERKAQLAHEFIKKTNEPTMCIH